MEDHDDDDDADEELEFLPRLHVFVRPQEEKSGSSQEREEPQQQPEEVVASEIQVERQDDVVPDANPRRNPEDDYFQSGNSNQSTEVSYMRLHLQVKQSFIPMPWKEVNPQNEVTLPTSHYG